MIDTKLLRQKILDLAIRGKLVPQDPNDEPASELLKRIKAEKEALIKAGKIKRDKHESYIFRGEDKRYYEQIDGKTLDISEQILFDIPESWKWTRLNNIATTISSKSHQIPEKDIKKIASTPVISQGQNYIDGYSDRKDLTIYDLPIILFGDHTKNVKYIDFPFIVGADGCKLVKTFMVSPQWLYYWLSYSATTIRDRGYARHWGLISSAAIPLPPLNEQKRIVSQVESLLKFIDGIDGNAASLENAISFAKQKILDLAIRGKLVPQDPNDEPASELLKKIKAEKETLIKSGKLKRDKHESFIFRGDDNCYHENVNGKSVDVTDKIPFELPKSWEWCKIGNIGILNPKNHLDDNVLVSFMPMAQLEGGYGSKYELSEKLWKDVKKGFTHFGEKDIVLAKITPCFQNRKSAIMSGLKNGFGAGTTELHVIRCFSAIFPEYVLMFLKNKRFISDAASTIQGVVGQQRVDGVFIKDYLIPLPPFAEQKRIVSQIEKLFSILETMHG